MTEYHFEKKKHHKMQKTLNNCFGSKRHSMTLRQAKTNKPQCRNITTRKHSCLPVFAWRRVVLSFFDPKQLLRVSCNWWCFFFKVLLNHYSKRQFFGAAFMSCLKLLHGKEHLHEGTTLEYKKKLAVLEFFI